MSEYNPSPPVIVGDTYKVTIESTGDKGDGVTHIARFAIFVPGTEPGQEVNIKITNVRERFAFAEVINL